MPMLRLKRGDWSSLLYRRFPRKLIGEASDIISCEYSNEAKERPGLILLAVILAAHRNYTKQVEPQINRIRQMNFNSFQDLKQRTKSFTDFALFCGMRDMEKYTIIVHLLAVIDEFKNNRGIVNDFDVMQNWTLRANCIKYMEDIVCGIKGIGIATFQHLRMNFGANTVKPDQRVKEVLNREFRFCSNNEIDYISAVEYIAMVIQKSALYVDQVFVNYGSGYCINNNSKNVVDIDVSTEIRGDGGSIAVANKLRHLSKGKNVFTYWTRSCSVAVIILGLLDKKTFYGYSPGVEVVWI